MLTWTGRTADWYCEAMRRGELFSIARYGDGEIRWMLGEDLVNCDGHRTFPAMAAALRETFLAATWECAIPDLDAAAASGHKKKQEWGAGFRDWLDANNVTRSFDRVNLWVRSLPDGLPILAAAHGRRTVLVGPEHLRPMGMEQVIVPASDAYLELPRVVEELEAKRLAGSVVFMCCGPAANLLIADLAGLRAANWLIDLGCVLDPLCGRRSRPLFSRPQFLAKIAPFQRVRE